MVMCLYSIYFTSFIFTPLRLYAIYIQQFQQLIVITILIKTEKRGIITIVLLSAENEYYLISHLFNRSSSDPYKREIEKLVRKVEEARITSAINCFPFMQPCLCYAPSNKGTELLFQLDNCSFPVVVSTFSLRSPINVLHSFDTNIDLSIADLKLVYNRSLVIFLTSDTETKVSRNYTISYRRMTILLDKI